jgi:hypothetical protein
MEGRKAKYAGLVQQPQRRHGLFCNPSPCRGRSKEADELRYSWFCGLYHRLRSKAWPVGPGGVGVVLCDSISRVMCMPWCASRCL